MKNSIKYGSIIHFKPIKDPASYFMEEDVFNYEEADNEILDFFNDQQQTLNLNVIVNPSTNKITIDLTTFTNKSINLTISE